MIYLQQIQGGQQIKSRVNLLASLNLLDNPTAPPSTPIQITYTL